jgi:hypothetical protein
VSNGFPGFMSKVRVLPALGNMFGIGGGGYEVGGAGFCGGDRFFWGFAGALRCR